MNIKDNSKQVLLLMLSVGIVVPLWGTFHSFIGVKTGWPAFVAAALFFAFGHKIKDSIPVSIGHLMGVGWGMAFLFLLSRPEFHRFNPLGVTFLALMSLGFLAVLVTHLGVALIASLPSLFCGWAVTVGTLGGLPVSNWGWLPLDTAASLLCGIFILGVGIPQLHSFLVGEKHAEASGSVQTENQKTSRTSVPKYLAPYRSPERDDQEKEKTGGLSKEDLHDIKQQISDLKQSLGARVGGGGGRGAAGAGNYLAEPIKIVGICGSPHKKSSTVEYVRKALEAAESVGNVTTTLIELAGKELKPCMGCKTDKCYGKCRINDAMHEFYPLLREADGIIIGSPSYFGTFSAQLKIFIDRLRVLRHTDFQLCNKVIGTVAVAGRRHGGQEITNLDLVQAMMRHNTIIVNDGTAVCQLGATGWSHTFDDPGSKVDDDAYGLETSVGVGRRVAEIAKVIKASGLQKAVYKYNAKIGKR